MRIISFGERMARKQGRRVPCCSRPLKPNLTHLTHSTFDTPKSSRLGFIFPVWVWADGFGGQSCDVGPQRSDMRSRVVSEPAQGLPTHTHLFFSRCRR